MSNPVIPSEMPFLVLPEFMDRKMMETVAEIGGLQVEQVDLAIKTARMTRLHSKTGKSREQIIDHIITVNKEVGREVADPEGHAQTIGDYLDHCEQMLTAFEEAYTTAEIVFS